jgi:hypothetical protein
MNAKHHQCRRDFFFWQIKRSPHSSNFFLTDNVHAIVIALFRSRLFRVCQMKNRKNKMDRTNRKMFSFTKKKKTFKYNNRNNNSFFDVSSSRLVRVEQCSSSWWPSIQQQQQSANSAVIKTEGRARSILGGLSIAHIVRHLLLLTYYPDRKKKRPKKPPVFIDLTYFFSCRNLIIIIIIIIKDDFCRQEIILKFEREK